ncbi:hypothetical protein [Lentibacillus sp. Marseille-P4043]|uniref:hypothetical protein n=1 Tax=Lentibacillus sp. Marseille-P4043 TaxID=2040293 RepID=UPI000D0B5D11|nr:hypothetical protein [Lentibacillus sp. Marseille-P4043]
MNIDIDRVIPFLLMWGFPIFFMARAYAKMDTDERNDAKKDFKTPRFIFTIGFLTIGLFIAQVGSILSINLINTIGTLIFIIGGIVAVIDIWGRSKIKSMLVSLLFVVAIFFLNN